MNFFNDITWSPAEYVAASVVAREMREGMLARLDLMTIQPKVILDLGCGTGEMTHLLKQRYPHAQVIGVDASEAMLNFQPEGGAFICATGEQLPLPNQSIDLIVANLIFPWVADARILLKECKRVLRSDGLFMLTALGLDTMQECREICQPDEMPTLVDMHDIGDGLLQEKFAEPVMDVDHITLVYKDYSQMLNELCATGMWLPANRPAFENVAATDTGWQVTYEIIFGHAFVAAEIDEVSASEDGMVRMPISRLREQLRQR